jgi:hypothetical protein
MRWRSQANILMRAYLRSEAVLKWCGISASERRFDGNEDSIANPGTWDGEVCINGIECPAEATLRFQVHKRQPLGGPVVETVALNRGSTEMMPG